MAVTQVDICNMALMNIGESHLIQSLDESSTPARACKLWYERSVKLALGFFPWPWATTQAVLSLLANVTRVGWEYVYALPGDCVTPLALLADGERIGLLSKDARHPFALQWGGEGVGSVLCTDLAADDFDALEYIAHVDDPASYPEAFVQVVAWVLSGRLAMAIKKDPALAGQCMAAAQDMANQSAAHALTSHQRDPDPLSPTLAARG